MQGFFIEKIFHRDTLTCSALCLKDSVCNAFAILKNSEENQLNCVSIMDEQNLLTASEGSSNSVKIYHKVSEFSYIKVTPNNDHVNGILNFKVTFIYPNAG